MDPNIEFTWKGIRYTVESRACPGPFIVLPGGTLLQVDQWIDGYPPQVGVAHEVKHSMGNMLLGQIAEQFGGKVASLA